jgi:hypothetical protein
MLRRVALVRTGVSEERIASIIRVTRIGKPRMSEVNSNRSTQCVTSQKTAFFISETNHPIIAHGIINNLSSSEESTANAKFLETNFNIIFPSTPRSRCKTGLSLHVSAANLHITYCWWLY